MIPEQLIRENEGLIWKIAKSFYGVDKYDLFQAGALGIVKAYNNYEKNGQTKFSTYAHDYIYGEMYKLATNREIKVSKDILSLYKLIEKTRYTLAQEMDHIPTNQELAHFLEMDVDKIDTAVLSAGVIMSLDDDNSDARSLHETIAHKEEVSQDDKLLIDSSFKVLDPLEQDIIHYRYYEDLTQSQIAKRLGITQVMVSRYEQKGLSKMREFMHL